MAGESREDGNETLTVGGENPLQIALDDPPEWIGRQTSRQRVGFECASGDWIEREYEVFPVMALIEAAGFPADTTHVVLESGGGYRACVPVTATGDAVVAVGDEPEKPRFLSPDVVGPRAIKNLDSISPRSLGANEDIEEYERLPIDDK